MSALTASHAARASASVMSFGLTGNGRILFERVAVDSADLAVGRRGLREGVADAGDGRGKPAGDLGIHADQLRCTLANIPGEGLSRGLPGGPLRGRSASSSGR